VASEDRQQKQNDNYIPVNFPASLVGGSYCNNLRVLYTKEEFIMDFMMVAPPSGAVTARVVMSPGHFKRTIAALQDNFKKYESKYGSVEKGEEPKHRIGFIK
jgi:hypothetical protein